MILLVVGGSGEAIAFRFAREVFFTHFNAGFFLNHVSSDFRTVNKLRSGTGDLQREILDEHLEGFTVSGCSLTCF